MSDAAITTLAASAVTITGMVVGFLTLWVKLQHASTNAKTAVEKAEVVEAKVDAAAEKIDAAAELTKKGTQEATDHAKLAVKTAAEAKEEAKKVIPKIEETLNGNIEHTANTVESLKEYIHMRNHDILGHLQTLTNKMELLLRQQPPNGGNKTQ